jgi:hypothetical protein
LTVGNRTRLPVTAIRAE